MSMANVEAVARNRYDAWNRRLLETFFSPASSGEEVFLQVSPEEIDSLGPDLGGDEGFVAAVRASPIWVHTGNDVFAAAIRLAKFRRMRTSLSEAYIDPGSRSRSYLGRNAPSYLPHLAALVRSTAACDDAGFYNHLRRALQLPDSWGSPQMAQLEPVWEDLQRWTKETKDEFGRFSFRVLGGYSRIGVPRSQGIMSRRDDEQFSRVFAQVGLRPGQSLTDLSINAVKKHAADAYFLSAPFKQALGKSAFAEPINVRLRNLLEDWDGTVPSRISRGSAALGTAQEDSRGAEVSLVLGLQSDNTLPWQIKWRVPPLREDGRLHLKRNSASWSAQLGSPEGSTSWQSTGEDGAAAAVLSELSNGDVNFSVSVECDEEVGVAALGTLVLLRRKLWVLVWKCDSAEGRYELREDSLPLNGAAYLLAPPENETQLRKYLQREELTHEFVDDSGLPQGWILACLPNCGELTAEQRNMLPDGADENERPAPRALRLVGGRFFTRAGSRHYASYDLPTVELDAPPCATIRCSGLKLTEEPLGNTSDVLAGLPLRRFRIVQDEVGAESYQIVAMFGQELVGSVRLRVSANAGERVEQGDLFSLDRFGYPQRDSSGLRGILLASEDATSSGESDEPLFEVPVAALGAETNDGLGFIASQFFLDFLARKGSMAYGEARDQLARLLSQDGSHLTPGVSLLELRARGHVEIQTNHKGHLIRVHAVQPALYELPMSTSGRRILGVIGSLRLTQWDALSGMGEEGTLVSSRSHGALPTWRLVMNDPAAVKVATERIGLALRPQPATAIAAWAAPLEEVASRVFEDTGESLGAAADSGGAEKFSPASGYFLQVQGRVAADRSPKSQLFRLEDRETGRLRIHAVSIVENDFPVRYAFVRDSRWGVWLALRSFADFVRQSYGIDDASPWPIPYSAADGTFWLPARISPPVALERALVLCSGDRPELVTMSAIPTAQGMSLSRQLGGMPVAIVSMVYEKMAVGNWLAYKWVPRTVACLVAKKIGGTLTDV